MSPLSTIHKVIGGVLIGALLLTGLWGWRVDSLRARYKDQLASLTVVIRDVQGLTKLSPDKAGAEVHKMADDRDQFKRERDNARAVIDTQSQSIRNYEAETNRLKAISADNVKLAASLIKDRDTWIAKAKAAATRTERLSCDQELKETENVLDALYQADY